MTLASLQFRREHCVRFRFRYSACERCAEACPHEAIALDEEGVRIDASRCRNCALCSSACQTEALMPTNFARKALAAQAIGKTAFTIACAPSQEPADARVPCLGALDAVTLAAIGRSGVALELRGSAHCAGCEHAPAGAAQMRLNLEGVGRLRAAAGDPGWPAAVVAERVVSAEAPQAPSGSGTHVPAHNASRRHLFRRFLGRGVEAVAGAAGEPVDGPVPLKAIRVAAPVGVSRREWLETVWPRESDADTVIASHAALPLGRLALDAARCTMCEACARVCPTGALDVAESGVRWTLAFRASRCVACQVCVEACQRDALAMAECLPKEAALAKSPEVLHALDKKRCARCDRFFLAAGEEDHCPICLGDDADFTALFG